MSDPAAENMFKVEVNTKMENSHSQKVRKLQFNL